MSSELLWQLVKNHNSFQKKGLNGIQLSAEPGNLYNLHSYKHSGLANSKTVHLESAEEGAVAVTVTRPKNFSKPLHAKSKTVTRKPIRQAQASLAKQMDRSRPDLKKAALARISAIDKSHRVVAAAKRTSA